MSKEQKSGNWPLRMGSYEEFEELDETLQREAAAPVLDKSKLKHDDGKLRVDLIPPEALVGMAEVFGFGTRDHEARSWERGIAPSRVLASVKRHILAWELGEDYDESGQHHFDHALCEMAMLVTYERRKMLEHLTEKDPGARVDASRTKARVYKPDSYRAQKLSELREVAEREKRRGPSWEQ